MNFLCWFIDEWRIIWDILNIHKSHPPRSFGLLYISLFYISKHISISVLFFIISVSCFVFPWILEKKLPRGWGFSTIFLSQGGGSALSLCLGGGEFAFSKNSPGVPPRGMVRLGIDWYISPVDSKCRYREGNTKPYSIHFSNVLQVWEEAIIKIMTKSKLLGHWQQQ